MTQLHKIGSLCCLLICYCQHIYFTIPSNDFHRELRPFNKLLKHNTLIT